MIRCVRREFTGGCRNVKHERRQAVIVHNKFVSAIAFDSVMKEVHPASALEGSGAFG